MRRILFWMHLCVGCTAGVVSLVMCVTGVLLAFERQVNNWADSQSRKPVHAAGTRLPLAELLEKVRSTTSGNPSTLTVYRAPDQPIAVAFGRERTVFADPYTGEVLGEASKGTRAFFGSVERWHRALGGELRGSIGRMLTGAGNLLFLGLAISGIYLWLPRKWNWKSVRPGIWFRGGLAGRARNWNWHNTTGIWCAVPLIVITLSGVIMSYQWANNLLYTMTGSTPPPPRNAQQPDGRESVGRSRQFHRPTESGLSASAQSLDSLFARTQSQEPQWRSVSWTVRRSTAGPMTFAIDSGNGGQPERRSQLTLDGISGKMLRWEPFSSYNLGRRLRSYARFAHTGEEGGLAGQIVAAIASLGGAFLIWTGISLAVNRLLSWIGRRHRPSGQQAKAVRAGVNVSA